MATLISLFGSRDPVTKLAARLKAQNYPACFLFQKGEALLLLICRPELKEAQCLAAQLPWMLNSSLHHHATSTLAVQWVQSTPETAFPIPALEQALGNWLDPVHPEAMQLVITALILMNVYGLSK